MMRKMVRAAAVVACVFAVLGTAGVAAAVDAPKWVAALYVESQKMVGLRWVPVPGATYKVLRSVSQGVPGEEIGTATSPQYLDTAIEPGVTYFYTLKAVAGAEVSPAAPEKIVEIPGVKKANVVNPPTMDSVALQVDTQFGKDTFKVGVLWHGNGPGIAYNLYRSTEAGKQGDMLTSSQDQRYVDVAVEVGKTYYYSVSALDASFQETKLSEQKSVEIKAPERTAETAGQAAAPKKKEYPKLVPIPVQRGERFMLPNPPYDILTKSDGTVILAAARLFTLDMDARQLEDITPEGIQYVMNIGLGLDDEILAVVLSQPRFLIISGRQVKSVDVPENTRTLKTMDGRDVPPAPSLLVDVTQNIDGKYWVTDNTNARIVIFDENAKFLTTAARDTPEEVALNVGSITHNSKGKVYAGIVGENQINMYDKDGKFLGFFGETGNIAGSFGRLGGLFVDADDNVWATDLFNTTIQKFDGDGKFLGALSGPDGKSGLGIATPNNITITGDKGIVTQGIDRSVVPMTILK